MKSLSFVVSCFRSYSRESWWLWIGVDCRNVCLIFWYFSYNFFKLPPFTLQHPPTQTDKNFPLSNNQSKSSQLHSWKSFISFVFPFVSRDITKTRKVEIQLYFWFVLLVLQLFPSGKLWIFRWLNFHVCLFYPKENPSFLSTSNKIFS